VSFVNIRGIKVYYEVHGDGDTIVLLHHGFGSTKMWKDIYPSLVEKGYRVIMYDRRGYGQSERGTDFEEFYVSDRFCLESVEELALLRKFSILIPSMSSVNVREELSELSMRLNTLIKLRQSLFQPPNVLAKFLWSI
jgi:pimeloyl-ACP methyl ester carboxylesterase